MYHQKATKLELMVQKLFDKIFAVRYRDVCETVRAVTTEGISQWCILLPSLYLNDNYLKYLAWSLSDKV